MTALDFPFDLIVLLAMFAFVAVVTSLAHPEGIIAWAREEWRLFKLGTWEDGRYDAPRACSAADPRVGLMVVRQRAMGKRMRRLGTSLLAGKPYKPALTRPVDAAPSVKSGKVYSIRRSARS